MQNTLFDKPAKTIPDRPLIAFAFLAQANSGNGDILSGIIPIFKPIAKRKAGEIFTAKEFCEMASTLYGISIHPWAIDELAPRLESSGILEKVMLNEKLAEYYYSEINEEFNDVGETDIQLIVKRFTDFSKPILERNKLPFDEKALEEAFFEQLISMDFVSILRKPDRTREENYTANTIRAKKDAEQKEWEHELDVKSKIEVLCAAFILEVYKNDSHLYDLLVKISNGAFVAEAVLNFRSPQGVSDLSRLKVILDTPFMMALLNLTSEENHKYAKSLCESLTSHGASLYAFKHSCDELKDNLNGVIASHEGGSGFGSTARRLNIPSFKAYALSVKSNPEAALQKIGIELVRPLNKTLAYQYFTEQDEDDFRASLGFYLNNLAQQRDAESLAYLMRLRRGKQIKMINFTSSEYIFVTENQTLAQKTTKFLTRKNLLNQSDVPAVITDKFLAGLLLVLYGGEKDNFTHRRLLANCAAALETRTDVINKVTDFLAKTDGQQADRFRAMMTDERAGQCLMQMSLGDSLLINDKNIPQLLDEVKKSLIEDHTKQSLEKQKELDQKHQEEIEANTKALNEATTKVLEKETDILIAETKIKRASEEAEQIKLALRTEKLKHLESDRLRIEKCVRIASKIDFIANITIGLFVALGATYLAYLKSLHANETIQTLIISMVGITAFFSYLKIVEWLRSFIKSHIQVRILHILMRFFVTSFDSTYFKIDWKAQKVESLPQKIMD